MAARSRPNRPRAGAPDHLAPFFQPDRMSQGSGVRSPGDALAFRGPWIERRAIWLFLARVSGRAQPSPASPSNSTRLAHDLIDSNNRFPPCPRAWPGGGGLSQCANGPPARRASVPAGKCGSQRRTPKAEQDTLRKPPRRSTQARRGRPSTWRLTRPPCLESGLDA